MPPTFVTNGNGAGPSDVGIWYCTYYDADWEHVLIDHEHRGGTSGYPPCLFRPLCSNKPGDYRTYRADDTAVIDFHLEQIAAARIDFLLFELTPGGLGGYRPSFNHLVDNARVVCQRIKVWNDNNSWKIKYAIAAGAHPDVYGSGPVGLCMEKEAEDTYKSFYDNPGYGGPDNYYQLNGKPLIVYWGPISWGDHLVYSWDTYGEDKRYGNCFTMRYAAHVFSGTYGWNILPGGTQIDSEVEVVSPGWGFQGTNPVLRNCGDFYRECWSFVLRNPKPRIVMIVGFNDYLERTAVFTTDTRNLSIDEEKWYGHDGKLHPAMYWDMTIDYVSSLRGGRGNG